MATIINKRNKIGSRFKEAVASLISFTPTTTITGTNVQAALEEVDSHVLASTAISDDEFEETTEIPRDADTLCGVDGNTIISDLSELKTPIGEHYIQFLPVGRGYANASFTFVPFKNADKYEITITKVTYYNNTTRTTINNCSITAKFSEGFTLNVGNSDNYIGYCVHVDFTVSEL